MKKKIIVIVAALLPLLIAAQNFVLEGKIQSDTSVTGWLSISYLDDAIYVTDSCEIKNNTYSFSGALQHTGAVLVTLTHLERPDNRNIKGLCKFYLSPGKISVTHQAKFDWIDVNGSQAHQDAAESKLPTRIILDKRELDTASVISFIKSHPSSWISYVWLNDLVILSAIEANRALILYNSLGSDLKKYGMVKRLGHQITGRANAVVGKMAVDFTQPDVDGNPTKLSDFRGKYLFLDFWASWCAPCRHEVPYVLKAYQKFKDKNFEVLGVSLDNGEYGRKVWKKAIEDDGAIWKHVSDLKGLKNEAAALYGVMGIPRNFLIDPNGKIIAVDLLVTQLEKKLEELFSN